MEWNGKKIMGHFWPFWEQLRGMDPYPFDKDKLNVATSGSFVFKYRKEHVADYPNIDSFQEIW